MTISKVFFTLSLVDSINFIWAGHGIGGENLGNGVFFTAGSKTLTAEVAQIRLTTTTGTGVFDLGSTSISWEF